jgi:homoserine dehydrogenase
MRVNIGLSGFGGVGRNLVKLLWEKKNEISRRYQMEIRVVTLAGRQGSIHALEGLDLKTLWTLASGGELTGLPGFVQGVTGPHAVQASSAGVWVEASSGQAESAEPGLSNFRKAFQKGMHVVTLSKGPMVYAFDEMVHLAGKSGVKIKYSGAAAAALPTIDIALHSLAGSQITSIEGILNGTSNYVLTLMEQEGISFAEGLQQARQQGIAEADSRLDVEGWDTAHKILIIANTALEQAFSLKDATVEGITKITAADLLHARRSGGTIKLVGSLENQGSGFSLKTAPKFLPLDHPLAAVNGTTKGIHFCTDTMGPLTVIGGFSNPRAAAAAALKDIISIYRR